MQTGDIIRRRTQSRGCFVFEAPFSIMKRKGETNDQVEEQGDGTIDDTDGYNGKRNKIEHSSSSASACASVVVVDSEQYLSKRIELLQKEKELTKLRDEVTKLRQALPWTLVEKNYQFTGPTIKANDGNESNNDVSSNKQTDETSLPVNGVSSLRDLFRGRSQLIVHHFMFGPDWEAGCKSCSFMTDHVNEATMKHLAAKDVSYVAIGRAPIDKLVNFQRRMGWDKIPFYSSYDTTFNYDFKVAFDRKEFEEKKKESSEGNSGYVDYNFKKTPFFMDDFPGISVFAM